MNEKRSKIHRIVTWLTFAVRYNQSSLIVVSNLSSSKKCSVFQARSYYYKAHFVNFAER